ncbi:TadE family protein [Cohnella sp. REN36]|uniref:TadE family protein n=1 Tax=Cohnella sp. REN36 TaxID=2887347 RepID=UPI001D141FF2|nr:TadE family protein [Cohnella sp. REN36]MCC3375525.1 pilus assembly protein [Cohnella sp. REN36]
MRRPIWPKTPTNRTGEGSVTLEAALVMPVFMLAILFLIYLVQTAVISMALHGALSQTARQTATAWYPISAGLDQVRSSPIYQKSEQWSQSLANLGDTLSRYGRLLPAPIGEWAKQAADGDWNPEQIAARQAFRQVLLRTSDPRVLRPDRLEVVSVTLPAVDDLSQAYLTVEAEYRLPFQVPFLGRTLVLRESASERAWIGGAPSRSTLEDGEEPSLLSFVSLEPNPVRRGRKATLTLRAKPGETVDLTVLYKSGPSQAKHLGTATADASGLVSWTWHVSGNTTIGTWAWEARASDGAPWRQTFEVAGKEQ